MAIDRKTDTKEAGMAIKEAFASLVEKPHYRQSMNMINMFSSYMPNFFAQRYALAQVERANLGLSSM